MMQTLDLFATPKRLTITPRDYQLEAHDQSFRLFDGGQAGALIRIFTGGGKCLGKGTPVLMYDGRIVPVEEVKTGDKLMGPDGGCRNVMSTTKGTGQLYRIVPKRGEPFVCNDEHILCLKVTNFNSITSQGLRPGEYLEISVKDYLAKPQNWRDSVKGYRVGIDVFHAGQREDLFRSKDHQVFGFDVEDAGIGDYYGFEIDGDRRFLLGDFTVTHNTISACMLADTWLNRGDDRRVMIVSYEKQLVWQFAQEVQDVLGITPGIEMEKERATNRDKIVVASRQSLMLVKPPTDDQIEQLAGIDLGGLTQKKAAGLIKLLDRGASKETIADEIWRFNQDPESTEMGYSRLFRFDNRLTWLVIYDEAHKHAYKLKTVRHLVDWFDRNSMSKRIGLTATPKRFDGVSIGDKMFPGVAVDYPLFSRKGRCAVKDGYAVPYRQKYIAVEGVDFASIKKIAGDFDDAELERVLGAEKQLATLCEPMLDLVGDKRTLIFSPGVEMAKNVAHYINARRLCHCACGRRQWVSAMLIGDGAECECGKPIIDDYILDREPQARAVYGTIPASSRKELYRGHQDGKFQFLSVCGLCREGYNDPDIGAIAIFRPVSKAASSLAEQMKGRGSRPLRGLIDGLGRAEDRLEAIANSEKPDCLIVDLVGVTGLADCASTVAIYDEGLPDEVIARAQQKLLDGEEDIEEAIEQSEREIAEERERIRQEREEAERRAREEYERRAKAGAKARYSEHDVGHGSQVDPNMATDKQLNYIRRLGLEFQNVALSKRQAGRIIDQLLHGESLEEVARTNRLSQAQWIPSGPTAKQLYFLNRHRISRPEDCSPQNASDLISAYKDPARFRDELKAEIKAADEGALTAIGKRLAIVRRVLNPDCFNELAEMGMEKRSELQGDW